MVGILNGVDASIFNPASDPHLDHRFTPEDRRGKAANKRALQKELGLPTRPEVPLFVAFGEIELEEGYGALLKLLPRFLRNDVQLVLGGVGDPELITALEEASGRWPDRLQLIEGDTKSLHRLLGAADFFVVPTPYAPCGERHMQALRYGAVPIVREAGGLGDAVVNCDARAVSGTGFLYEEPPREGLLGAMQRAASVFADQGNYGRLCRRAMLSDLSWERAAYLYERLYRSI
jgi:starch synthase